MQPLVEELVPAPDPVRCCERLAELPYRLLLDSAAPGSRLGRYSFLTADPVMLVTSRGDAVECLDRTSGNLTRGGADALAVVREKVRPFAASPVPGLPPFQGGAAGYLAYDWSRALERLPSPRYDDLGFDDVVLGLYDWVLAWDHAESKAWLISTGMPEGSTDARARRAEARSSAVRELIAGAGGRREPSAGVAFAGEPDGQRPRAPSYPVEGGWWDPRIGLRSSFTRDAYLEAVSRVREYVFAGDIFQANLSQRFEAPLDEPPWKLYLRLRAGNAAPFAAFMDLPELAVLSASPERFLRVDGSGHVETRPIKGTRPRGLGPEHDAALGQALTESAKDRAENLMIVDLMRNDLSRVCAPGTVRVSELFALERYATVHHLVSTVVGELEEGLDGFDLLRAAFPGGSITGAPKVRAMEIIAELEPSRRGVYCGSIGYWSLTGELDTSIAIRTAVARGGRVYFNAGGGIIADSSPEQEYLETLDKARGIIDALAVPL
ncbi:MAG TPA: aminodeoxychorismate synthase component I [Vicinamibacterales bacterium]|nr:aminodeoxychorismate synthase component I [Vicinamibacterales bacterium]